MGVNTRRTDGQSVQLVAPVDVVGGDPAYVDGFHGIVEKDTGEGGLFALAIDQGVYELELADGETGASVGDIVYLHGDTEGEDLTLELTASGGVAFAKIVEVDGDDELIVLGKLLENRPDATS